MARIDIGKAKDIINKINLIMVAKKQYLIELDRVVGDGDLGITMERAFSAADSELKNEVGFPGKYFMKAGAVMAKTAPSTMGTLVATGFLRGGRAVKDHEELTSKELHIFFKAFLHGVKERGKAKTGEKTIVDVLSCIVSALELKREDSLENALIAGLKAAENGLESTKKMIAQHGKAAVFREKTLGLPDQGGTACLYIFQGFKDAVCLSEYAG